MEPVATSPAVADECVGGNDPRGRRTELVWALADDHDRNDGRPLASCVHHRTTLGGEAPMALGVAKEPFGTPGAGSWSISGGRSGCGAALGAALMARRAPGDHRDGLGDSTDTNLTSKGTKLNAGVPLTCRLTEVPRDRFGCSASGWRNQVCSHLAASPDLRQLDGRHRLRRVHEMRQAHDTATGERIVRERSARDMISGLP